MRDDVSIHSGLSKGNFKDHYGEAVKEQCLDMIAEIVIGNFNNIQKTY